MKRLWLKITGLTFFVLAAIIGVYILWPAKSPDLEQIQQQDASTSAIKPSTDNQQPKRQLTPEDFQTAATTRLQDENPREQELRKRAALLSSLYRNPDSLEAAKARESLLKAPGGQFAPFRKDSDFKFLNVPRGDNTKKAPPKPSPQEDEQADANKGEVSRQNPVNPDSEGAKGLSDSIIREHMKQYKANRREMFPSYADSSQFAGPKILTRRLPQRYDQLLNRYNREGIPSYLRLPPRGNPGQFTSFKSRNSAAAFVPKGSKTRPHSPTTNYKINTDNKTTESTNK